MTHFNPLLTTKEAVYMATKTKKAASEDEAPQTPQTPEQLAEEIAAKRAITGAGVPSIVAPSIDEYVAGVDGELHVYTEDGYLAIDGEAQLNGENVLQLVRVLEQATQAVA